MELLLAERALLIGLDDATGRVLFASESGLVGALLLDLGQRGLLRAGANNDLVAVPGVEPAHPVLCQAYEILRDSAKPRDTLAWMTRLPGELKPLTKRLAKALVERGVLSEDRSRLLGVFPRTRFPEIDPAPERHLRERLVEVLVVGRSPTQDEALLVGLLDALGLIDGVVPKQERKAARKRAKQIGEPGVAGIAVADAMRQLQSSTIMTATIPVITSGSF